MTKPTVHTPAVAHEVVDFKVVALYDPTTGKILHTHTVKVFKGGRPVSEKEAVDTAHGHAKRIGHDVARLKTKVSTKLEHAERPHRIDPKTEEFVQLPAEELRFASPPPKRAK